MTGRSACITEAPLVELVTCWNGLVDIAYQTLAQHHGRWRRRGCAPAFSDSEVIAVALIIDTYYHGLKRSA